MTVPDLLNCLARRHPAPYLGDFETVIPGVLKALARTPPVRD